MRAYDGACGAQPAVLVSSEPPWVQTAASDDRAAAQEKEAVGVNGLQDVLGGDGRGVCTHPHSLGDLLAEAYARGHGLGESGGDGSLRTIPLVRRAAVCRAELGRKRFRLGRAVAARWLAGWLGAGGCLALPGCLASKIRPTAYRAFSWSVV